MFFNLTTQIKDLVKSKEICVVCVLCCVGCDKVAMKGLNEYCGQKDN